MPASPKRQYFNQIASRWDNLPAAGDAPRKVRLFVEKAASTPAERILDIGCGTGILLPSVLEKFPSAKYVLEVDFAEGMLKENASKLAHPSVHRLCADVSRLPLPGRSFELLLCFGILPHLEDQGAALREFWRVLRPGGALCVGHLMSSRELNAFHSSLDAPVARDFLPPAGELASSLNELGTAAVQTEEEPGWYFVRAEKLAR